MHKTLGLTLFLALMLQPVFSAGLTEKKFEITFDVFNPQSTEFPGGRGTNQFVVYSSEFGARTGTNEWGVEAVVDNGLIVSVGGNDHRIPENGYVLSAHGTATSWFSRVIQVGLHAVVYPHERKLVVSYDLLDRLNQYRIRLEEVQNYRAEHYSDYSRRNRSQQRRHDRKILQRINRMEKNIRKDVASIIEDHYLQLDAMFNEAWYMLEFQKSM